MVAATEFALSISVRCDLVPGYPEARVSRFLKFLSLGAGLTPPVITRVLSAVRSRIHRRCQDLQAIEDKQMARPDIERRTLAATVEQLDRIPTGTTVDSSPNANPLYILRRQAVVRQYSENLARIQEMPD